MYTCRAEPPFWKSCLRPCVYSSVCEVFTAKLNNKNNNNNNNNNSGEFCAKAKRHQNSPELLLLKLLPLTYHHSHFLAATLDFTSFFTIAFLKAALFLQLGCFGLDIISFCICIPQRRPMAGFGLFNLSFFLYHRKKKR